MGKCPCSCTKEGAYSPLSLKCAPVQILKSIFLYSLDKIVLIGGKKNSPQIVKKSRTRPRRFLVAMFVKNTYFKCNKFKHIFYVYKIIMVY